MPAKFFSHRSEATFRLSFPEGGSESRGNFSSSGGLLGSVVGNIRPQLKCRERFRRKIGILFRIVCSPWRRQFSASAEVFRRVAQEFRDDVSQRRVRIANEKGSCFQRRFGFISFKTREFNYQNRPDKRFTSIRFFSIGVRLNRNAVVRVVLGFRSN